MTAPDTLRSQLEGLGANALVCKCAGLRPGSTNDVVLSKSKRTRRSLALHSLAHSLERRHKKLTAEISDLDTRLRRL